MNHENDLSCKLAHTLNQYIEDVNAFAHELFGNYAMTVASYAADICTMFLEDKYYVLMKLAGEEEIHKAVTNCEDNDYERAQNYLNDFMQVHGVFQSIIVKNNFKQIALSAAKENPNTGMDKKTQLFPCLSTAPNSRYIKETGSIATFCFEIKERGLTVGTLEAGISAKLLDDAFATARKRIPYLKSICMADEAGQILYPESFARNKSILKEIVCGSAKKPCGYLVTYMEKPIITGYASVFELPFMLTSRWILVCELITSISGRTTN